MLDDKVHADVYVSNGRVVQAPVRQTLPNGNYNALYSSENKSLDDRIKQVYGEAPIASLMPQANLEGLVEFTEVTRWEKVKKLSYTMRNALGTAKDFIFKKHSSATGFLLFSTGIGIILRSAMLGPYEPLWTGVGFTTGFVVMGLGLAVWGGLDASPAHSSAWESYQAPQKKTVESENDEDDYDDDYSDGRLSQREVISAYRYHQMGPYQRPPGFG